MASPGGRMRAISSSGTENVLDRTAGALPASFLPGIMMTYLVDSFSTLDLGPHMIFRHPRRDLTHRQFQRQVVRVVPLAPDHETAPGYELAGIRRLGDLVRLHPVGGAFAHPGVPGLGVSQGEQAELAQFVIGGAAPLLQDGRRCPVHIGVRVTVLGAEVLFYHLVVPAGVAPGEHELSTRR